jgi:hypothetical protein
LDEDDDAVLARKLQEEMYGGSGSGSGLDLRKGAGVSESGIRQADN